MKERSIWKGFHFTRDLACDVWPNITGKLSNPWAVMKGSAKAFGSGAIVTTHNENSDWCGYSNATGVSTSTFEIKASVSNMAYSGSKLQPKAGLTLLCIKI